MKETRIKTYRYHCSCGYELKVFLDAGIPQETCKCRMCGVVLRRKEC